VKALLLAAAALVATPAVAETVAITGGTVAIGDGSAPVIGNVVVRDGRIVAAGAGVAVPPGARVVDATGKWVAAGIVAGFSRLGLVEVDAVDPTNDAGARNTVFNASLDVVNGLNSRVPAIAINRSHGITRAVVAPDASGNMFAGQGAVIDLTSNANDVTKPRAFQ
jgi:imidazolonepropionase-like amidohydrolase